ncbi:uncharacterized protein LOC126667579 isoform X2 [Mercurialis annua]|uniref:uncharacterized protein LOC126667579 isoform X2 n=1 Tax=Mercurialis annua TaxID=3986 RepID=UPI0024ACF9C0|nr:uncharacterized protein LOC126667579 isoform X2 [Mercurialis annua]
MALGFQEKDDDAETEKDAFLTIENHKRIIFHVNDRVEVFSEEEGFQGSWHPGTVVLVDRNGWKLSYHVKYDHLLDDDSSEKMVGCLHVSELVDDDGCAPDNLPNNRGRIRPLEDRLQSSVWDLCYGRCVDVHYNEGWWEGVVFDHEDGSKQRNIFFPELGDEMMFHVDRISISRDWNDITGVWQIRETWLFLELIEEHEKEHYVPVSIKQLWYDLREKERFKKIGEWTSKEKDLWKSLVLEAIDDNWKILIHHVLQEIGLPESTKAPLGSAASCHDANNYTESDMAQKDIILQEGNIPSSYNFYSSPPTNCRIHERSIVQQLEPPAQNGMSKMNLLARSDLSCPGKPACEMPLVLLPSTFGKDGTSVATSSINAGLTFDFDAYNKNYSTSVCKESTYLPVGADVVPGPEFFPDAIRKYAQMGKKRPHESIIVNCRKHLLFLNWKVECARGPRNRFRYTSPDGKQYYSLIGVCAVLSETHKDIISSGNQDENANLSNCPSNSPKNPDSMVSFQSDIHVVEPEYCLEAVLDWYKCGSEGKRKRKNKKDANQMIMKAKKHLALMGWIFRYVYLNGKRELRYISPSGRRYNSLRAACGDPRSRIASVSGACASVHPERKADSKTVEGQSNSFEYCSNNRYARMSKFRNLGMLQKIKVGRTRKSEKKRKKILESSFLQQKSNSVSPNFPAKSRSKSKDLIRGPNKTKGAYPNIVLRSSKRVKHLVEPNPSHRKPRTVLSWLVDNTDVLPRAKLTYCASNGGSPVAEGRISGGGSGIKCNCCGKLYSVSGFEFHATGQYGRLAGSILSNLLLEDGRSLLDCQMQVIHTNKKNFRRKPLKKLPGSRHQGENDHICSVCHYGGELILCDQCPSSFHHSCLGMTDVPDGDWFCSSCCCDICGQNKLKRDSKHSVDDYGVLNCTQCERKYHIGCIRTKGEENLDYISEGNWFCSKTCEEICVGLHELSGKPVAVHLNNLTWTMLKCTEFENRNHNASDTEAMSGNYCHLCIALDVMHECFEPIEEPYTRKDLLKDVIFSKSWEDVFYFSFYLADPDGYRVPYLDLFAGFVSLSLVKYIRKVNILESISLFISS